MLVEFDGWEESPSCKFAMLAGTFFGLLEVFVDIPLFLQTQLVPSSPELPVFPLVPPSPESPVIPSSLPLTAPTVPLHLLH